VTKFTVQFRHAGFFIIQLPISHTACATTDSIKKKTHKKPQLTSEKYLFHFDRRRLPLPLSPTPTPPLSSTQPLIKQYLLENIGRDVRKIFYHSDALLSSPHPHPSPPPTLLDSN
jgi:hypothetical protein